MHFHFSFYSSLLLIFFTHGLLFTGLLLARARRPAHRASYWLAGFTFVCTLNILPWMLGHAGWYSLLPYREILFYLPLQQFFLLGPLIFFYTRALLNPAARFTRRQALHFLPAALYLLYTAVMFVADEWVLRTPYFYADGRDRDLDTWYRLAGIASLSVYTLLSLGYYAVYKRVAAQVLSFADDRPFRWIRTYLTALLLMQVLDLLFFALYPGWGSFTAKWWYYFLFSVLFYYVAFTAYTRPVPPLFAFRLSGDGIRGLLSLFSRLPAPNAVFLLDGPAEQVLTLEEAKKPAGSLSEEESAMKQKILQVLTVAEGYRDPELTLTLLAKRVGTNSSVVSRVVNRGFGCSFNDLVNRFRVEALQQALAAGAHRRQTLLSLALDCGFNSKTTFNRVFRRHTGCSPRDYIRRLEAGVAPSRPENDGPDHDSGRPGSSKTATSAQINPA